MSGLIENNWVLTFASPFNLHMLSLWKYKKKIWPSTGVELERDRVF